MMIRFMNYYQLVPVYDVGNVLYGNDLPLTWEFAGKKEEWNRFVNDPSSFDAPPFEVLTEELDSVEKRIDEDDERLYIFDITNDDGTVVQFNCMVDNYNELIETLDLKRPYYVYTIWECTDKMVRVNENGDEDDDGELELEEGESEVIETSDHYYSLMELAKELEKKAYWSESQNNRSGFDVYENSDEWDYYSNEQTRHSVRIEKHRNLDPLEEQLLNEANNDYSLSDGEEQLVKEILSII